jgi:hypothetical protein
MAEIDIAGLQSFPQASAASFYLVDLAFLKQAFEESRHWRESLAIKLRFCVVLPVAKGVWDTFALIELFKSVTTSHQTYRFQ